MTSSEIQVKKTKTCCSCLQTKDLETNFYRNKMSKDGRYNKCKVCLLKGLPCKKRDNTKEIKKPKREGGLFLTNVRKEDWVEMFGFLTQMGYDLNISIHEQFCKKYNLSPRTRMYEKSIQYSPSDLGLI